MEERFEAYNEIINELLSEAISCSPETWTKGNLNITCDGRKIDYKLKNELEDGKASISEELRQLCEKTYITFTEAGDVWSEANFSFSQNEDGGWGFKTDFTYPESPQNK